MGELVKDRKISQRGSCLLVAAAVLLFGLTSVHSAEPLKITPQLVVDKVLGTSDRSEEVKLQSQKAFIGLEKALGRYDFNFFFGADYEYAESEELSGLSNPLDKTYGLRAGVSKLIGTGTVLGIDYAHFEQSSVLNPIIFGNSPSSSKAKDQATLTLRQNIWRNFFGISDRLILEAQRQTVTDAEMQRRESMENLALEAMRLYWKTYVSQIQLRDSIASRERYTTLVSSVRRKSRFGLERGGELGQVSAEFEDANQRAKLAAEVYLLDVERLNAMINLGLPQGSDLSFEAGEPLPPVPQLSEIDLNQLRRMKVAKNAVETMKMLRRSATFLAAPQLDLIGKASTAGVETTADRAYAEMTSVTKPTYFIGIEFRSSIDSASARADIAEAEVNLALQENRFRSLEKDLRIEADALNRKVKSSYEIAKSAIEASEFRERTVREQDVEFRNGRIALAELIRTYNSFFESQARRARAVGDYHVALNELAAFRDELVD